MSIYKANRIQLDGSNNAIVQNVKNSNITINTKIPKEIEKLIGEIDLWMKTNMNSCINLLVVSTSKERLEHIKGFDTKYLPSNYYGEEPKDWKPYCDEATIFELLIDYHKISGFNIKAIFIDEWEITDLVFKSKLKDQISKNTILIVDGVALEFKCNEKVSKIFDKKEIGGCLVPLCAKLSSGVKSHICNTTIDAFEHLHTSVNNIMNDEYMNIELFIPTKDLLFRRLTNIAIKHLNVFPILKGWDEEYQKMKNDPQFKLNKASLNL